MSTNRAGRDPRRRSWGNGTDRTSRRVGAAASRPRDRRDVSLGGASILSLDRASIGALADVDAVIDVTNTMGC